jgi:hypothetical protein
MSELRMVRLQADSMTADDWALFGWLPVADTDPADGAHTLSFDWGDPHLNVIAHAYDEIDHTDGGAICAVMYRHLTHTQALMSLNVPAVVAVAAPDVDFGKPADIAAVRAFLVQPQDVFTLHKGTWHWGPFPLAKEPVQLLNVQGLRYAEDNGSVDLGATTGAVIEVVA